MLRLLWADPQYMPEHLALWSLKHFGPRASKSVENLRSAHHEAGPGEFEARVIAHQTRVTIFLVGLLLPLVWVPYMAWAFRKSGLRMGARASAYYSERRSREAGVIVTKAPAVRIAMSAGLLRVGLLIVLPIVIALIALLIGADIGTGKWLSALIFLIVVSALLTLAWVAYHWWRRRSSTRWAFARRG